MADSITREDVAAEIGLSPVPAAGTPDGDHLDWCVDAVNAMAPRICPAIRRATAAAVLDPDVTVVWPGDALMGCILLGARLFSRRNSPTGIAAYNDMGGPAYISRFDPDLERLFGTGAWLPPMVG